MSQLVKYCRTLLAGSLVFGGALAISVIGVSLSASPAAAASAASAPSSHSVISKEVPLRSVRPLQSKGLVDSVLPTLGGSSNSLLGGLLVRPTGGKAEPTNGKADQSSWTIEPSPNLTAGSGSFNSESCSSARNCMAVGYYVNKAGVQLALAEEWNGSKWSIEKLPKIPGVLGSAFFAVSCTSSSACTAVGVYSNSPGTQVTLAEVLSGTAWSIETTPNPSGAQGSSLSGVSCTSAKNCIAVGGSEDGSNPVTTLVENRKGTTWSIESSPNVSSGEGSILYAVSCTSTSACTAVGAYDDSSGAELTLAEVLSGTTWSIETTSNPAGEQVDDLHGVSCTSTTTCTAVGAYVDSSGAELALAEAWTGGSWSLDTVPNPSGAVQTSFAAVACTSASRCTAVGASLGSSGKGVTLSEMWKGTSWSVQTTPNPSGALATGFAGVSCTSATACGAVGVDIVNGTVEVTLGEAWNGTTWSVQATPNPKGEQINGLLGVSCTSADACIAVGGAGVNALSEVWNGTSWSIKPTPEPSGSEGGGLSGVSCTSASACTAVGYYVNSSDTPVTLAETWNGTSWSIQSTPNPSGGQDSILYGVSCTSSSACTAVGEYDNSSDTDVTLAEAWNGSSWSIETTPNPSGGAPTALSGVSCISASACTAVGASGADSLAEDWNGTSWSIQPTPDPSGAQASILNGVDCNSAGCTAAGEFETASLATDFSSTLVEVGPLP